MDLEAIMTELKGEPGTSEYAKAYQSLLESSESEDTDSLRDFVDKLRKQNGEFPKDDDEEEPAERAEDHLRMVTKDRETEDIEYYTTEELGPSRELTPEGFLVCYDVPVARTGEMIYGPNETPISVGSDGRCRITRSAKEVFSAKSMASLAGKPVTDDHPPVDVDPGNWRFYTRGVVVNPRRGGGEHKDFLVVDIIIFDADTIRDIQDGKREVSCGYNPDYLQVLDDAGKEVLGQGEQCNIIYNHLALVERGRCGPRCSIGDSKTVDHAKPTTRNKEKHPMSIKSLVRDVKRAFRAKDEEAFGDAMEDLEEKIKGEDEEPDTVEVHNHIPGEDAIGQLPPKDPATTGIRDEEGEEGPPWFKKFSKDCLDRFTGIDAQFEAIKGEPKFGKDPVAGEEGKDEDPSLEMDKRGKDAKDDEANRAILGELEYEAPPGTGDKARKAKDSEYLADSFQDTVAKAEVLVPGIRVPTFDQAAKPRKTFDAITALRRTALDLANSKPETRGIIDSALSGRALDTKTMPHNGVRVLFNAVASQVAAGNNSRATDRSAVTRTDGKQAGAQLTSLADINARNREKFGRKTG